MSNQSPNKKRKKYYHHKPEIWTCTICKRCLSKLRGLTDDNGNIYLYECERCGETYAPYEIAYTEK